MPRSSRRRKKPQENNEQQQQKSVVNPLEPKTGGQRRFMAAIKSNPVVICDGPAGTGKTFISFGSALHAHSNREVQRIVLVRPTIPSSDEPQLGFLPGDLDEKMAPFLAPLLFDSAPLLLRKQHKRPSDSKFVERHGNSIKDRVASILSRFDIEVVPLQFMRGRTFHNSFVILDEAQNCTMSDFRMFLTRIGEATKVVIEGDGTQRDRQTNALGELIERLDGLPTVGIVQLSSADIVRNPIISDILKRLS